MLHVAVGILYWEDGSKNETLYNYGKKKKNTDICVYRRLNRLTCLHHGMVKGKDFVVDVKERRARDIRKNQSRERESNRLSMASKLDQRESKKHRERESVGEQRGVLRNSNSEVNGELGVGAASEPGGVV